MQRSESGLPIEPVYRPLPESDRDLTDKLGETGECPFTCGGYPTMYAGRPWTVHPYPGFGTAAESNARYKQLIADGTNALSVAFDRPTQMGHDSDAPIASGEVGKGGVAIDSLDDMRVLFGGIPLGQVSTYLTINAPAAPLLLLYQLVAEEQGVPAGRLTGTIQNDILNEYISCGTYIFPPEPSLRLTSDIFQYCQAEMPQWNTISISGHYMAEAGATPEQEIAFTLANGIEYIRTALASGMNIDDFAPRISFFVARVTLLEEVAKYRAAHRIWAHVIKDRFGAVKPKSQMLRFHRQTAGVQVAAVLGGAQSLRTNSFDEAVALTTDKSARRWTQQVLAHEVDATSAVGPFTGSYVIEKLTDDIEAAALVLMHRIEELGGAAGAIREGYQKREIEGSARRVALQAEAGERVDSGVNRYRTDGEELFEPPRVDPVRERQQAERIAKLRAWRLQERVDEGISRMQKTAQGTGNVLNPMKDALAAGATIGEVCNALRQVWGTHRPSETL
ncbi:Methylmalonyl-CoA mutase large subunit [Streptomyces sp. ADI96-15]|uniref:acyl-CoA mutase large subunit family protein n=1 Tax=Streptomyces TaxID=1883 RepID=UPI0003C30269|nr:MULTISPECIES: acyl-CoA mutase large subunit family protein [unclassified Streptomyces]ESQ01564.1 methylmalonyll-CoA mutase [Streptomyces sp. GBA 94-10 4N24]ESQ07376.1 methylmalonyll-CoA mutase [Streptomyces sp. PVA_94-07]RPK62385.1 Methylmalonyl-CoA mutase large subunit [Streptomyces sp. ADI96-15]UZN57613.1 methylmalonyll-CoA mutase [Streptomyces sp. GBA 94-10 4N24]